MSKNSKEAPEARASMRNTRTHEWTPHHTHAVLRASPRTAHRMSVLAPAAVRGAAHPPPTPLRPIPMDPTPLRRAVPRALPTWSPPTMNGGGPRRDAPEPGVQSSPSERAGETRASNLAGCAAAAQPMPAALAARRPYQVHDSSRRGGETRGLPGTGARRLLVRSRPRRRRAIHRLRCGARWARQRDRLVR